MEEFVRLRCLMSTAEQHSNEKRERSYSLPALSLPVPAFMRVCMQITPPHKCWKQTERKALIFYYASINYMTEEWGHSLYDGGVGGGGFYVDDSARIRLRCSPSADCETETRPRLSVLVRRNPSPRLSDVHLLRSRKGLTLYGVAIRKFSYYAEPARVLTTNADLS